ncbi:50S ribosomal protein L3 [Promineifilum sp.]|uniref:50S ribosomal protein L3 n=1 Tax=Promineifilum sp. TaxID=2664178 RepID=UPI0035B4C4F3
MKGLIGKKIGMTQVFDESGVVTPVTIIQAGPCYVTQVKDEHNDGYSAIQVGYGEVTPKRLSGGEQGHLGVGARKSGEKKGGRRKSKGIPAVKHLREFRTNSAGDYQVGQQLTVAQFEIGEKVDVVGKTKGRGFAGNVKRHKFAGGVKTHGQSDRWRAPGSIGSATEMSRVPKGKRMAGRMGNERQTAQNLEVVRVDAERNLIAIKGAVPGAKGGLVIIRDAAKG